MIFQFEGDLLGSLNLQYCESKSCDYSLCGECCKMKICPETSKIMLKVLSDEGSLENEMDKEN